jgi:hypothetical protein
MVTIWWSFTARLHAAAAHGHALAMHWPCRYANRSQSEPFRTRQDTKLLLTLYEHYSIVHACISKSFRVAPCWVLECALAKSRLDVEQRMRLVKERLHGGADSKPVYMQARVSLWALSIAIMHMPSEG